MVFCGKRFAMRTLLKIIIFASVLLLPLLSVAANNDKNFGGVGVDGVPLADGRIKVNQLVNGGAAHLAGMLPGDIITHIDGKPTLGSNFKQMVDTRLRGAAGTTVVFKVQRGGVAKPMTFRLKRQQLLVKTKQ